MSNNIRRANFYALNSVAAWQENRIIRILARRMYRKMITNWYKSSEGMATLRAHEEDPQINPYAWPLRDEQFASWAEDDRKATYSLISDPADMVAKYSTSYCACMIYAYTGRWLTSQHGYRDANYWITILDENNFRELYSIPKDGGKFIGILKDIEADDGRGLVVWFERWKDGLVQYSTYKDHAYKVSMMPARKFHWIKIK